jgi:Xaa-Pro dipeptidase
MLKTRRRFLLSAAAAAPALALTGCSAHTASSSAEDASPSLGKDAAALPPAIAALKPRLQEAVPIALPERETRLERARALLRANHIDALVITGGTSLNYFAGLRTGQSERLLAWVLPANAPVFIVCPSFEEGRIRESLASAPAGATTRVFTWQEHEDPYNLVARSLKDLGLATATLGVEERTQFAFSNGFAHATPALTLVSGTPVTAGCRMIKSPAELALMQLANDITLQVYEAAWKSATPGMTNDQLTHLIGVGYNRCGVSGEASCQVGTFSALPHGSPTPQVIREGELILIDDGCTVLGYQSDISRSFVLGHATSQQNTVFDIVHKAQAAALAAAHPGVPCQAIDAAARAVVVNAGYGPDYKFFSHRLGHGIGMDGHEWPYLVRNNTLPLQANMCFSDEPGIYIPGSFGIRLEDDWHLTEDGGRMFTPQSPSLEAPFART